MKVKEIKNPEFFSIKNGLKPVPIDLKLHHIFTTPPFLGMRQ